MNEIVFPLSNGMAIRLSKVCEVMGHDDSLPFNAVLYVDKCGSGEFTKVASVWNDGWGGLTQIDTVSKLAADLCEELDGIIKETYEWMYHLDGTKGFLEITLESIINTLAGLAIDNKIKLVTPQLLEQLSIFEKKKVGYEVGEIASSPRYMVKTPGVWKELDKDGKHVATRIVTMRKDFIDGETGEDITTAMFTLKQEVINQYSWELVYKF